MSTDHIEPAADPVVVDGPATDSEPYDDTVQVWRDGPLSAVVGAVGAAVAVAYLLRAVGSGAPLDWALFLVTGVVGLLHLVAFVDSRAPLMVLDHHGVRVRRGREWQGVAWSEVDRVEHRARQSLLRDGSLAVVCGDGTERERRLGVRLSLSTRLTGSDWHELGEALGDLSEGRTTVVDLAEVPEVPEVPGVPAAEVELPEAPQAAGPEPEPQPQPQPQPTEVVAPSRDVARGRRSEVVLDQTAVRVRPVEPVEPGEPADPDATEMFVMPAHQEPVVPGEVTTTIVIDDAALAAAGGPVVEPVVGPQLAAARRRLGLSVDQLAERTRIRPHVIESIETDDFAPCGGDFYARGHLRTLARILGVDAEPLLASYDELYAGAPIDPRRVFEAELATGAGGSIRGTRGRLNWSVLVAAVMAVVLLWSVARLVMDGPAPSTDQVVLNGSPGARAELSGSTSKVPVSFTAATGGAHVIVRDGRQQVVFDENLAFMQTAKLSAIPPVRISSTDGGLTVSVDGDDEGALGASGEDAQRIFVP